MSLRPELHSFQQMMQQCPLPGSGNKKELLIAASLGDSAGAHVAMVEAQSGQMEPGEWQGRWPLGQG